MKPSQTWSMITKRACASGYRSTVCGPDKNTELSVTFRRMAVLVFTFAMSHSGVA